jgi:hypothetical protein
MTHKLSCYMLLYAGPILMIRLHGLWPHMLPKDYGELSPEEIYVGALSSHSRLLNA